MAKHRTPCTCDQCLTQRYVSAIEQRRRGKSLTVIARELDVSTVTVWRYLKLYGEPKPSVIEGTNKKLYRHDVGRPPRK